jgi:hypothetical protein
VIWKNARKLPRLTFPTKTVGTGVSAIEEYIIPDGDKEWVLEALYPFDPIPALTDEMYDLHQEETFQVREFRVLRGEDMDWLVSPYYFESGGTVIDWVPPDIEPGQPITRRIRGSAMSVITASFGPRPTSH